jgi:hypothetical protein
MVPALPETLPDDTEFDLDVRLAPVTRHLSDEPAEKAGGTATCSCQSCWEKCP